MSCIDVGLDCKLQQPTDISSQQLRVSFIHTVAKLCSCSRIVAHV